MKLALFDLDHTLLPLDSDHSWGQFTTEMGWTDPVVFGQRNDEFYAHYQAGTLDIHDYVRFATEAVRRRGAAEAHAAHAEQLLREARRLAEAAGVACDSHTTINPIIYEAILAAARERGGDLIVMASHGRRGLAALLLGSETQRVLTHAAIPVLVSPSSPAAAERA